MEDTSLVKVEGLPPSKYSDEQFALATKTGDWLPRLQLMTSNSSKVAEGKFPMNHYALINGQNFQDVGDAVDILVLGWRPKAIEMGDEVITVYAPDHPEFKRIQDKSEEANSGCMYGPEYILWVPSVREFATFFMGSKSARREAPGVRARMHQAATLKSHTVKTKKYTWQVSTCIACSTPFDPPDQESIAVEVNKFENPPETDIQRVSAEEKDATSRAR